MSAAPGQCPEVDVPWHTLVVLQIPSISPGIEQGVLRQQRKVADPGHSFDTITPVSHVESALQTPERDPDVHVISLVGS